MDGLPRSLWSSLSRIAKTGMAWLFRSNWMRYEIGKAHNSLIDLEDRSQEELDEIEANFASLTLKSRNGKMKSFTGGSVEAKKSRKSHGTKIRVTD
jgi:hypothetical protein